MPNRESTRDPAHGDGVEHRGRDEPSRSSPGKPEARTFSETTFQAHDARLGAELESYDRDHQGSSYPLGGSRFRFFTLGSQDHVHPDTTYDFDPDYLHWRDQQMQRHDHDYADWRRHQKELYDDEYQRFRVERRDDFHERFQDWRMKRDAELAAKPTATREPNPDDKL